MHGKLQPSQKKQPIIWKSEGNRDTMANASTRWHAGPLSSAVTGDVMLWKNTVYITFHSLPSFTITDSVPFPQGQGFDIGVLRSLGEGERVWTYLTDCIRGCNQGIPTLALLLNVTGFPLPLDLSLSPSFPRFLSLFFVSSTPKMKT